MATRAGRFTLAVAAAVAPVSTLHTSGDAALRAPDAGTSSAWCTTPRFFVTHHKSGTVLSSMALAIINWEMLGECEWLGVARSDVRLILQGSHGVNFTAPALPDECSHEGTVASELNIEWWTQLPVPSKDARVVHIARNAWEMVVSSYAYDLNPTESAWQSAPSTPSDTCVSHFEETMKHEPPVYSHDEYGNLVITNIDPKGRLNALQRCSVGGHAASNHCGALVEAARAHETFKGLPPMGPGETWATFVARVGEDEGLLAEGVMMNALALRNMARVHSTTLGTSYQSVCEAEFEQEGKQACISLWHRVLRELELPQALVQRVIPAVAAVTCPGDSDTGFGAEVKNSHATTREHAAKREATNVTQASDRVRRLMRLDADRLGGLIKAVDEAVPCPFSARYKP